jgi:predicted 3-demethylubiquinone-9 3-methyltransferase (glyoxalase superfamily)
VGVSHNVDEEHAANGSVLTIAVELDGQKFTAPNGGPIYKFTEALVVRCDNQQEVDEHWASWSPEAAASNQNLGWGAHSGAYLH